MIGFVGLGLVTLGLWLDIVRGVRSESKSDSGTTYVL